MKWLVLGLILWIAAHLFRRVMPRQMDAMGKAGRPIAVAVALVGLVLMVIGYGRVEYVGLYPSPGWMWQLNNLAMLLAIWLAVVGMGRGVVAAKVRHPVSWAVIIWAAAHLLVNGDLASLVLFGGMALWASLQMAAVNHDEGAWSRPQPGPVTRDVAFSILAILIYVAVVGIHYWLGYSVITVFQ